MVTDNARDLNEDEHSIVIKTRQTKMFSNAFNETSGCTSAWLQEVNLS